MAELAQAKLSLLSLYIVPATHQQIKGKRPPFPPPEAVSQYGPRPGSGERRTRGLDVGGNTASLKPAWMAGSILLGGLNPAFDPQETLSVQALIPPVVVLLSSEIQLLLGLDQYSAEM